jgi:diacylglycerol kinase (ATP)
MYYYIINPTAGRGAINNIQDKLRDQLTQLGIAGEFVKTTGAGDATKLARDAVTKGFTTIVAVGGDETVSEVMNGIDTEKVAIGIIPIGNSNKLANHLGLTSWQQALPILAARRLTNYRLIAAGQKFFLSSLTIGFETDIDKQLDSPPEKIVGKVKHFRKSWGHARNFDTLDCKITVDDDYELECKLFTLTIANQKFLNPSANNKLVISIADEPSRRQLTSYLWRGKHDQHHGDHVTTRIFADRVQIETTPTTGIIADGKVGGRTPIAIRLTDRQVRFICDKPASAFKPSQS